MTINAPILHPSRRLRLLTPSDGLDAGEPYGLLLTLTRPGQDEPGDDPFDALYVGGTGHINLVDQKGNTVLLSNVPVGLLEVPGWRVLSTNTTATLLVAVNY